MNMAQYDTLLTFFMIQTKWKKHYSYPRPQTLQEKHKQFYHRIRSLPTIHRYVKWLEDNGIIARRKRWDIRDPNNPRRKSSMIFLRLQGAVELAKRGVKGAFEMVERIQKWFTKDDGRFPQATETEGITVDDYEAEIAEIRSRAIKLGYI